jgi:hypothetical protein
MDEQPKDDNNYEILFPQYKKLPYKGAAHG